MGCSKRRVRPGTWATALAVAMVASWTAPSASSADVDDALRVDADVLLNAVRQRVADCARSPRLLARADAQPFAATATDAVTLVERPPLRWNPQLASAAGVHALAMAHSRRFDHVGSDGRTVRERVDATGYRWRVVGENLAAGQDSLADAISDWLASPSHCAALIDARFTEFGIARADARGRGDLYGRYWTLVLGRPR